MSPLNQLALILLAGTGTAAALAPALEATETARRASSSYYEFSAWTSAEILMEQADLDGALRVLNDLVPSGSTRRAGVALATDAIRLDILRMKGSRRELRRLRRVVARHLDSDAQLDVAIPAHLAVALAHFELQEIDDTLAVISRLTALLEQDQNRAYWYGVRARISLVSLLLDLGDSVGAASMASSLHGDASPCSHAASMLANGLVEKATGRLESGQEKVRAGQALFTAMGFPAQAQRF